MYSPTFHFQRHRNTSISLLPALQLPPLLPPGSSPRLLRHHPPHPARAHLVPRNPHPRASPPPIGSDLLPRPHLPSALTTSSIPYRSARTLALLPFPSGAVGSAPRRISILNMSSHATLHASRFVCLPSRQISPAEPTLILATSRWSTFQPSAPVRPRPQHTRHHRATQRPHPDARTTQRAPAGTTRCRRATRPDPPMLRRTR